MFGVGGANVRDSSNEAVVASTVLRLTNIMTSLSQNQRLQRQLVTKTRMAAKYLATVASIIALIHFR